MSTVEDLRDYMHWAKTKMDARYTLASSGVRPVTMAELGATLDDVVLQGPPGYGWAPLTQALAARMGVAEDCVVSALGTTQANHLAIAALVGPGDDAVVEHPAYEPLLQLVRHRGATPRTFERRAEDGWRIDPAAVRRAMTPRTRTIVITNLHNPTGAPADEATLAALGAIARDAKARVVVDEVYLEVPWIEGDRATPAPRSAFHLGPEFVVTSSLTKGFGLGGLRCGWILAEPALAARMWSLLDMTVGNAPHVAERLCLVALNRLPALADRARALLAANRPRLTGFLDGRDDLEVVRPAGGTVMFPRWRGGDVERLCARLRERYATSIVPGRFFGAPEHFRIGIGGDTAVLTEGLDRLGRALDELR
ncbi:MAG: aminotransferase class I/II-fold pyridoxal phosphate-dependent enzyme [Candidatus Eisenbacteria bacterium]|nr:aminotransferase class I/II-fold pyridoxal phosphate-dependent enzyme [Candidatus Eisenbacteria bacterium]